MFNSTILDVAIGLAFTYLLLALICTTLNEWMAGILKTRGKMLEQGIKGLLGNQTLGDTTFAALFNKHPLIGALRQDPKIPPSYIAPRTFALAVMDLVTAPGSITFADLEKGIQGLPPGCVKTALLAVIQNANGNLAAAQKGIEDWFSDAMDRVSGWYTRNRQVTSVVLAVIVTLFVNADTLNIANKLWINPPLRQVVVDRVSSVKPPVGSLVTADKELQTQLGDVTGWSREFSDNNREFWKTLTGSYRHLPGWILTIVAVSLGAPFWFDVLNRFMNIRSAGKSPAEEGKGPGKDPGGSGK